jgi:hypothetical protein
MATMSEVVLPGDSSVKPVEVDVPEPRRYMIGCTSPSREAHGWLREGGHAEFPLAEEATCILLPDELFYVGGALTPHLHPLAHGATAVARSLPSARPSRLMRSPAQPTARG